MPTTMRGRSSRSRHLRPSIVFCGNDGGLYRSTDGGVAGRRSTPAACRPDCSTTSTCRPDATGSDTRRRAAGQRDPDARGAVGPGWIAAQGGDGWDVVYDGDDRRAGLLHKRLLGPGAVHPHLALHATTAPAVPTEITPWGTTSDAGCYLAPVATDPSTGGIVYASGNQNLWQSRDGGDTWRNLSAVRRYRRRRRRADQRQQRSRSALATGLRLDQRARRHGRPAHGRDIHRHHAQPAAAQRRAASRSIPTTRP